MAEAGDGRVGAAPSAENGAAAQPIVEAPAAPVVRVAAVVLVPAPVTTILAGLNPAAPVAAMLAGPVIPNPAAPPTFDVDAVLMGPLPRKSTMTLSEILPWVED